MKHQAQRAARIEVRQMNEFHNSRQWGVYVDGRLVEGGFFGRLAAQACADRINGQADTHGREPMADILDY